MLGCWRWAEHAQALAHAQQHAGYLRAGHASPPSLTPSIPSAGMRFWRRPISIKPPKSTPSSDPSTATRTRRALQADDTAAVEAAKRTLLGQVYLDWGTWAVVRDLGQEPVAGLDPPDLPPGRTWTTVEFTDLRFQYTFLATNDEPGRTTLGGAVYLVSSRYPSADKSSGWEDAGEVMNGRPQR